MLQETAEVFALKVLKYLLLEWLFHCYYYYNILILYLVFYILLDT